MTQSTYNLICFLFSCSSPTYQISTKNKNSKNKLTLKEAPLVDPEPTSDISNFNVSSIANNNGNAPIKENEPSSAGPRTDPGTLKSLYSPTIEIFLIFNNTKFFTFPGSPPPFEVPDETVAGVNLPTNLQSLLGQPADVQQIFNDRRVILYILSADDDHSTEKAVLKSLYENLKQYCQCRGFELQLCDLHDTADNFLDPQCWRTEPVDARNGHHLKAECLAAIKSKCH